MEPDKLTSYLIAHLSTALRNAEALDVSADIEVLHRYRVALRRTLSLLKLYRPHCSLRRKLKPLLTTTNTLRELDVLMVSLTPRLDADSLAVLQKFRLKRFRELLGKKEKKRIVRKLDRAIATLATCRTEEWMTLPMFFQTETRRTLCEAMSEYQAIPHHASEETFHRLRIRFKLCRYGLEFLRDSGIYNDNATFLRVKAIQDHLGEIQDLRNQRELLARLCKKLRLKGCKKLLKARIAAIETAKKHRVY